MGRLPGPVREPLSHGLPPDGKGLPREGTFGYHLPRMTEPPPLPEGSRPTPTPAPTGRRRRAVLTLLRWSLWLAAASTVAALVGVMILANWPDEPLGDETALMPRWTGSGENNPLGRFQAWLGSHPVSDPDPTLPLLREKIPWDPAAADDLLREESALLEAFLGLIGGADEPWEPREGALLADFSHENPHLKPLLRGAHLAAIEARRRAERGDPEAGLALALDLVRGGEALQNARGGLLAFLTGSALSTEGVRTIEALARRHDLAPTSVRETAARLARSEPAASGLRFAFQTEYLTFKHLLQDLRSGKAAGSGTSLPVSGKFAPFLQTHATLNRYREWMEPVAAALDDGWPVLQPVLETQEQRLRDGRPSRALDYVNYVSPNPVGGILLTLTLPLSTTLVERTFEDTADRRLVAAFLALSRHHADHGTLPDTLEALAPRYLPRVPLDPFTDGEPIRWDAGRRVLSSIGADRAGTSPIELPWDKPDAAAAGERPPRH